MSDSQKRNLTESAMVRLTPEDRAKYEAFAAKKGKRLPEMFRLAMDAAMLEDLWVEQARQARLTDEELHADLATRLGVDHA